MTDTLPKTLEPGEQVLYQSPIRELEGIVLAALLSGALAGLVFASFDWVLLGSEADLRKAATAALLTTWLQIPIRRRLRIPRIAVTNRRVLFFTAKGRRTYLSLALPDIIAIDLAGALCLPALQAKDGSRIDLRCLPDSKAALNALQRVRQVPVRREISLKLRRAAWFSVSLGVLTGIGAFLLPPLYLCAASCVLATWLGQLHVVPATAASLLIYPLIAGPSFLLGLYSGSMASFIVLRFILTAAEMRQFLAVDVDWHDPGLLNRFIRNEVPVREALASLLYGERIRCKRP